MVIGSPVTMVMKKDDLCIHMPTRSFLTGTARDTEKVPDPDLLFQRVSAFVSAMGVSTSMEDVFFH